MTAPDFDAKYWTVNDVLDAFDAARDADDSENIDRRIGYHMGLSAVLNALPDPHGPDADTEADR